MLIKKLKLRNFMIFRDVDLDLERVLITSITGQWAIDKRRSNGSGKSALIEAIPYALFGVTRSKQKTEIVHRGADLCTVEIILTAMGREIRIIRQRSAGGTSNAKVWVDGQVEAEQIRNVEAVIKRYLGIDAELFELIYFFRQDSQFGFVHASPGERKGYLSKVFDLSAVEACLALARAKHKETLEGQQRAEGAIEALHATLSTMPPRDSIVDSALDYHDELSSLQLARDSREKYLKSTSDHVDYCQKMLDEFDADTKDALEDIDRLRFEFGRLQQEKVGISIQFQTNSSALEQQKSMIVMVAEVEPRLNGDPKSLEQKVVEADQAHSHLFRQMTVLDHDITSDREAIESAKEIASSKCPVCYQIVSVDHVEHVLKEFDQRIACNVKLRSGVAVELQKANGDLNRRRSDVQQAEQNRIAVRNSEKLNNVIAALSTTVNSQKRQMADIDRRMSDIQAQLAFSTSNININDAAANRSVLQHKIDVFKKARDSIAIPDRTADISAKAAKSEASLTRYDGLVDQIDSAKRAFESVRRRSSVYENLVTTFGKNGMQAVLIENVVSIIEQFTNDILDQMQTRFRLSLQTQRETKAGETKETLEIVVYDNGKERMFETYSGGERTMINLALRLSLSRIISSMHGVIMQSLFLDEVLAALDEVNREEAIKVVAFLSKSFEQIFIISHTNEVKDIIPSSITVNRFQNHSDVYMADHLSNEPCRTSTSSSISA